MNRRARQAHQLLRGVPKPLNTDMHGDGFACRRSAPCLEKRALYARRHIGTRHHTLWRKAGKRQLWRQTRWIISRWADYDDAGRISAVRNLKSDGSTVLSIFTYSYDDAGNRTAVAEADGDRVTWSYDEIHQLTQEARSGANGYAVVYNDDEVGNRLTRNEDPNLVTYTYDAANQLTVEENLSARMTYSYDTNGNTEVINAAGNLTTYSWDVENHMGSCRIPRSIPSPMMETASGASMRTARGCGSSSGMGRTSCCRRAREGGCER